MLSEILAIPVRPALTLAVLLAVLTGCRAPQQPAEPLSVKLAVNDIYCTDTACACVHYVAARTYADTQERLSEYGIQLQVDYYPEPYNLEKAMLSGEYDGALCKPWYALKLESGSGLMFERAVDLLDPYTNGWLSAIVVVLTDAPFQSLDDLQGKAVVIGDRDAYEKHDAAKRLFEQEEIRFGRMEMTASCLENLGMLLDGKVDAAVVSDYALSADCAVDIARPEDFRILAATEPIPLTSVLLDCGKMTEAERARFQFALLEMSKSPPESLLGAGFTEPVKWNPPERGK